MKNIWGLVVCSSLCNLYNCTNGDWACITKHLSSILSTIYFPLNVQGSFAYGYGTFKGNRKESERSVFNAYKAHIFLHTDINTNKQVHEVFSMPINHIFFLPKSCVYMSCSS